MSSIVVDPRHSIFNPLLFEAKKEKEKNLLL